MTDTAHKLQAIDLKIKRWQSRLTRAHNAIVKLNRQRKRITNPKLMADYDAYIAKQAKPEPTPSEKVLSAHKAAALLDIPPELKRDPTIKVEKAEPTSEPKLADILDPAAVANRLRLQRMDAKRRGRSKVEVDKTAMPLSGKAALQHIKRK